VVVHLQRYYDVSYATMLSRLKAVGLIKEEDRERLRDVQPVYAARELGYQIEEEEWGFGQTTWGLDTLPKRLVRLVRRAVFQDKLTVSSAADLTGLSEDEIEELMVDRPSEPGQLAEHDVVSASTG